MSDWPWATPLATRAGLTDRIRSRFPEAEVQGRLREVAYRRFLARLFLARPDGWVVKGGVGLLLRLDPNRASNDIDVAFLEEAGEHGPAVEALRHDAAIDLGDFFRFEVGTPSSVDDADRSVSLPVRAYVGPSLWAEFSIDLPGPREEVPAERVEPGRQTELIGLTSTDQVVGLTVFPWPDQIADKICAIFEIHGPGGEPSSRARDLADWR